MKNTLPQYVKSCLWSYDTDHLKIQLHKNVVIPQVLNYGRWEAVKWLRKIYGDEEIKQIVKHPRRGIWFADVINFWEQIFNIKIDPEERKRAILDINPDYNYSFKDFNPA